MDGLHNRVENSLLVSFWKTHCLCGLTHEFLEDGRGHLFLILNSWFPKAGVSALPSCTWAIRLLFSRWQQPLCQMGSLAQVPQAVVPPFPMFWDTTDHAMSIAHIACSPPIAYRDKQILLPRTWALRLFYSPWHSQYHLKQTLKVLKLVATSSSSFHFSAL